MKNKLLSQITPGQLIQDFQQLGSAHKIAAKYGFNVATVYTAFKIINYDCRVRQDVASFVSKELLEEAYGRLGTLKAVGDELKIDRRKRGALYGKIWFRIPETNNLQLRS